MFTLYARMLPLCLILFSNLQCGSVRTTCTCYIFCVRAHSHGSLTWAAADHISMGKYTHIDVFTRSMCSATDYECDTAYVRALPHCKFQLCTTQSNKCFDVIAVLIFFSFSIAWKTPVDFYTRNKVRLCHYMQAGFPCCFPLARHRPTSEMLSDKLYFFIISI